MKKDKHDSKGRPNVVMEAEVARRIRQHGRSSMKSEVCGVLIGSEEGRTTIVEACIAGVNAAQGGAHVTFTQDTWEHIYQIKDREYPDARIVGWYHSHPGFGVFLSDHDSFIQQNFFSSPQQIAWVYDPHSDEEGCFGWLNGEITKVDDVAFRYVAPLGDVAEAGDEDSSVPGGMGSSHGPSQYTWGDLVLTVFTYFMVFVLGAAATFWFFTDRYYMLDRKRVDEYFRMMQQVDPSFGGPAQPQPNQPQGNQKSQGTQNERKK